MADPLSVAASIIGIIAAAGKVAETLGPFISTVKDTTKIAATIFAEVNSSKIVLSALQVLLDDIDSAPRKRRELIPVTQLVITLTDGAFIFSELESLVLQLGNSTEKWSTRIQWARKKDTLVVFATRLQLFKSSISVMLNILQCDSDLEATRSRAELHVLTSSLVTSNLNISSRLSLLERGSQRHIDTGSIRGQESHRSSIATIQSQIRSFGFEPDLEGSWVYRKVRKSTSDVSYRSSVALSHAWTALSEISLSDISAISVVALPISSNDLLNGHYYQLSNSEQLPNNRHQSIQLSTEGSIPTRALIYDIHRQANAAAPTSNEREQNAHGNVKLLEIGSPTLFSHVGYGNNQLESTNTALSSTEEAMNSNNKELNIGFPTPVRTTASENIPLVSLQTKSEFAWMRLLPQSSLPPAKSSQALLHKDLLREYKVVVVGNEQVERVRFAMKFLKPDPLKAQYPTSNQRQCMIDGSTATIEVLGTAAQEVYPAMQQENLRVGYGSILVYSITSRSSFLAIVEFRAQAGMVKYGGRFRYYTEDKFPLILVGCHCEKESERVVSFDEGECLARQVGCPFLEVAYETGQNIEKAYYDLVREIRRYDANEI